MRFVDTSFWVALRFARDGRHPEARAIWEEGPGAIMTSTSVLGETWTFLRRRAGHRHGVVHGVVERSRTHRPAGHRTDGGDCVRVHRSAPRNRGHAVSVESRWRGERGAGLVAGVALIFAFTFLGLVWLARDVDRGVSNRSAAQSIAFQAARSGAQAASIRDLRSGDPTGSIDEGRARQAAARTADALFASYGLDGSVSSVLVTGDAVSVAVTVTDGSVTVTGAGTVRAERAP